MEHQDNSNNSKLVPEEVDVLEDEEMTGRLIAIMVLMTDKCNLRLDDINYGRYDRNVAGKHNKKNNDVRIADVDDDVDHRLRKGLPYLKGMMRTWKMTKN